MMRAKSPCIAPLALKSFVALVRLLSLLVDFELLAFMSLERDARKTSLCRSSAIAQLFKSNSEKLTVHYISVLLV